MTSTHTRPDITAVLEAHGGTVPVTHRGGWTPVRCPYHNDSTASAALNRDRQAFTCHACGVKGDAYALIQYYENVDFKEALKLGDEYPETDKQPAPTSKRQRTTIRLWA